MADGGVRWQSVSMVVRDSAAHDTTTMMTRLRCSWQLRAVLAHRWATYTFFFSCIHVTHVQELKRESASFVRTRHGNKSTNHLAKQVLLLYTVVVVVVVNHLAKQCCAGQDLLWSFIQVHEVHVCAVSVGQEVCAGVT